MAAVLVFVFALLLASCSGPGLITTPPPDLPATPLSEWPTPAVPDEPDGDFDLTVDSTFGALYENPISHAIMLEILGEGVLAGLRGNPASANLALRFLSDNRPDVVTPEKLAEIAERLAAAAAQIQGIPTASS